MQEDFKDNKEENTYYYYEWNWRLENLVGSTIAKKSEVLEAV